MTAATATMPAPLPAPVPMPVANELPQPEPLANLIDFGNLHKVLAYILDNLKSQGARLSTLESTVSELGSQTNILGDNVATLRSLLLNLKPGGSEEDLAELRERVHVISGRVDTQSREVVVLVSQGKEHGRAIEELEAGTQALQTLMPTKADKVDTALKSVTDRHEREIEELKSTVNQEHDERLKALEAGLQRLSQAVETLANDGFKDEAVRRITDLENQVRLLTDQAAEHAVKLDNLDAAVNTKSAQEYVDAELAALLEKLQQLELALAASMKGELKRFERDVMIYVADQLSNSGSSGTGGSGTGNTGNANSSQSHSHSQSHAHSNTAAGKMHFRCLTCDQPKGNVPGASTFRYGQNLGGVSHLAQSDSRLLETHLGDQVYLHGTDGSIYKGRENVPALTASNTELLRLNSPQATARSLSPMPSSSRRSRPQSADPSRAHSGRQQIDPASGRKSGELLAMPLPLHGIYMADSEAKDDSATARVLFPPPNQKSARISGGSTSRTALASPHQSPQQLIKSSSNASLPASRARPSTATTRPNPSPAASFSPGLGSFTTDDIASDRVLMGRTQVPEKTTTTRNGVEIIRDSSE